MEKLALIYRSKERNEFSIEALFSSLKSYFAKSYDVEDVFLPHGRYNKLSLLFENFRYAKKIDADIYHVTGEVYFIVPALPAKKVIITVHDFVDFENMKGLKKLFRWFFWYYIPLHHCKYVACISQKTLNEVVYKFPFTKNKVIYAPNPIDDSYIRVDKPFSKEPRILVVGTRENKNVERIIEAVKDIECSLFIIGLLSEKQKMMLEENRIVYENVYQISDAEVRQAYIESDIVCFPSTYEGFGRPIIEANAIGRPVVTSNIEPMKEVASSAAVLVDPYDVDSIRDGINSIIYDEELRNRIVALGYENAQKYSAKYVSDIYMELYEKVKNSESINH